jgi:hypothetical protein
MEQLPYEIRFKICGYLNDSHPHRLSRGLSLVNWRWRVPSMNLMLRNITMDVPSYRDIPYQTHTCASIILSYTDFDSVRCLKIQTRPLGRYRKQSLHAFLSHYDPADDPCFGEPSEDGEPWVADGDPWSRMAALVKQMVNLSDFIYACRPTFPPCLREVLQSRLPSCKLQMDRLSLDDLSVTDLAHFTLFLSPRLVSMSVLWDSWQLNGGEDYTFYRLLDMIAGLTPNLRSVRLYRKRPGNVPYGPYRPWKFLPIRWTPSFRRLEELYLFDHETLDEFELRDCLQRIDCTALQVLSLGWRVYTNIFDWLAWYSNSFRILESVHLGLEASLGPRGRLFLRNLPKLRRLEIEGRLTHSDGDFILEQLGPALTVLGLPFLYRPTLNQIDRLHRCTHLERLVVTVTHFKGDVAQCALYEALGRISSLWDLQLQLLSSDSSVLDTLSSEKLDETARTAYQSPSSGEFLDEVLINSALDGFFVGAMFRKLALGSMLKHLMVKSLVRESIPTDNGGSHSVWKINRAWRAGWNPRDDSAGQIDILELEVTQ